MIRRVFYIKMWRCLFYFNKRKNKLFTKNERMGERGKNQINTRRKNIKEKQLQSLGGNF